MTTEIHADQIDSNVEAVKSFDAMGLKDDLLRSIYSFGFEKPSAIQQRAIVPLMKGKNLIAQAQSGTGKTAAFTIGILHQIDESNPHTQALFVAPTRELAIQTCGVVSSLSQFLNITCYACIGGTSVRETISKLKEGVQIVVGTPGRIHDMYERGALDLGSVKHLILDEADEMLSRGFKDQIYLIIKGLPSEVQIGLFSATMPPEALEISNKFMEDPVRILVKKEELTLEGIKQYYVELEKDEYKYSVLSDLFNVISVNQCVIFCNAKARAEWLEKKLTQDNFSCSLTHGDLSLEDRNRVLDEFRKGTTRVLITTDMLARGIDVQQVQLVMNYDLPLSDENYIHRIGRSARFGRKGVAINLITPNDRDMIDRLQKTYETKITPLPSTFMEYL